MFTAALAGCWIVAGTEDFEPESTGPSTSQSGNGAASSTAASATGGASQGGAGTGGTLECMDSNGCPTNAPDCVDGHCVCSSGAMNAKQACAENEVCTPDGCLCPDSATDPGSEPTGTLCEGAYPVCGMAGCECTARSCTDGFVCVAGECQCDQDSDCGVDVGIAAQCDEFSGLCICGNDTTPCPQFGQSCGVTGTTCTCVSCP